MRWVLKYIGRDEWVTECPYHDDPLFNHCIACPGYVNGECPFEVDGTMNTKTKYLFIQVMEQ